MNRIFQENVFHASYKALTENGVDKDIAEKASYVIAQDDFNQRDLGRTDEDRNYIAQAMKQYWENQKDDEE